MIEARLPIEIAAKLSSYDDLQSGLDSLKVAYAPLRFTHCSEDDIPPNARPVAEANGFDVYLVAGGEGCLSLTNDPSIAAGIVIAEHEHEDEDD